MITLRQQRLKRPLYTRIGPEFLFTRMAARLPGPDRRTEFCRPHEAAVANVVLPDVQLACRPLTSRRPADEMVQLRGEPSAGAACLKPLLSYSLTTSGSGALPPQMSAGEHHRHRHRADGVV
jgi:hypothetical protein